MPHGGRRSSRGIDVAEVERFAHRAAPFDPELRKRGLAAFVIRVERDQQRRDPLVAARRQRVRVQLVLVTGVLGQHLHRLALLVAGAGGGGDPAGNSW